MATKTETFRISQMITKWDEIFTAHARDQDWCEATAVRMAQEKVFSRYGSCIYHYLLGATRDHTVADELTQEFAFRFLRGDLAGAHPTKGRFRDYLRVALSNLVNDHFRRQKKLRHGELNEGLAVDYPFEKIEAEFNEKWRRNAIQQAWNELESFQAERNNHFYTVLKLRAEKPGENSKQLADRLSNLLGCPCTSDWVRQKIHRSKQKFAEYLVAEVRKTVANEEQLNDELADLRLLKYL